MCDSNAVTHPGDDANRLAQAEVFVLLDHDGGGEIPTTVLGVYVDRATAEQVAEAIHTMYADAFGNYYRRLEIEPVPLFPEGDVSLRGWSWFEHIAMVKRKLGNETERTTYPGVYIGVDDPGADEGPTVMRSDPYILHVRAERRSEAEAREAVDQEIARQLALAELVEGP